ncbi:hypothetical protein [Moorena sp. SIO3B2]|uniref:hypothetical protein n=1 Tax=Moorena sp. SIO3B2 TaxID=2607827 RepID=UPI0013C54BB0|nr:hypothetical protein [Moorena sp. SIO3B2]NEP36434.1 hypothetical protein [Moorena sp. SIO3B2]
MVSIQHSAVSSQQSAVSGQWSVVSRWPIDISRNSVLTQAVQGFEVNFWRCLLATQVSWHRLLACEVTHRA